MELKNSTIEDAVNLVQKSAGSTNCKDKKIGLDLTMLGLAEINALRISQLAPIVFTLERKVFSPEVINNIDPRGVVDLYRLAVNAMTASAESVKAIRATLNWEDLELQLLARSEELNKTEVAGKNTTELAAQLLKQLAKMDLGEGEHGSSK